MATGFEVVLNPDNGKFKVKRVNLGMGRKDGDNTLYISVPEDMDKLPPGVAVGAFNQTHPHNPVKRFKSLQEAREQGYEALRIMAASPEEKQEGTVAESAEKPKRSRKKKEGANDEPRGPRLTQIQPKPLGEQKAARQGTKIAQMIDLLAGGIFAADLKSKLERKSRALSGRVNRVHGYGVHSELRSRVDGGPQEVFYTLVLPEGLDAPLAHTVPEEKPAKTEATAGEGAATAEGGEQKPKRTRKAKAEVAAGSGEGDGAAAVGAE